MVSFLSGSDGKESACHVGDLALNPRSGRSSGEGNGNPTPVLLPGESHGRRSLVGYSPRGHKESDMTEQLHFTSQDSRLIPDIYLTWIYLLLKNNQLMTEKKN